MKQLIYILLFIVFGWQQAFAQPQKNNGKISDIKKAYIEDRIHLSPSQAQGFRPIYQRYESEKRNVRREYRRQRDQIKTGKESLEYIENEFQYQENKLSIQKKYKNEFLKVITPQQLNNMYAAEREFKQLLLQQLKERQNNNNKR